MKEFKKGTRGQAMTNKSFIHPHEYYEVMNQPVLDFLWKPGCVSHFYVSFSGEYCPYPYPVLLGPVRYLRLSIILWTCAAVLVGG